MYSRKIIENNLKRAEAIIRRDNNLPSSWYLQPPTNGERDEMRAHFETLLDSKGYMTRDFTREERLWVLIESTFCKLDFLYFATHYARIKDWEASVVYFKPNIAQQIVLNLLAETE